MSLMQRSYSSNANSMSGWLRLAKLGDSGTSRRNCLIALLVGTGIILRCWDLSSPMLFRDEAESAINALTILQHGVPIDRYLDLPIFENTLTRPWPESREYEFKDTSYSDRGFAIYHGWLPLYAMAASFAIFRITPDQPSDELQIRHDDQEMRRRTIAARAPSIVFAAIFLLALFWAGCTLYSPQAGILALVIGCFMPYLILASRQARYYSAALALGTLCIPCVWLFVRHGRWRDCLPVAVLLILLFHTHVMSFAASVLAVGIALPVLYKRPGAWSKIFVLATLITAGIVPWAFLTGFFNTAPAVPMAYRLLDFPQDLLLYPRRHPETAVLILGGLTQLAIVLAGRKKFPLRIVEPFREGGLPILFLIALMCLSNLLFLFFTPAASFFLGRLTLLLLVPGVLLAALVLAVNARVISPHNSGMILVITVLAGLAVSWRSWLPQPRSAETHFFEIVNYLRTQNLREGTRIYALPQDHLPLTFYTGLPVQSIAPVRKEFLDVYRDDILILDHGADYPPISSDVLRRYALQAGEDLETDALQKWQLELSTRATREHLARLVKEVDPPLTSLPPWAEQALQEQRTELTRMDQISHWADENPAIFRGYHVTDESRFWVVFFYRFVDPERRSGRYLNYASRIRSAKAVVLPSSWVVYHCDSPAKSASVAGNNKKGYKI